jgi:hypothetical protein
MVNGTPRTCPAARSNACAQGSVGAMRCCRIATSAVVVGAVVSASTTSVAASTFASNDGDDGVTLDGLLAVKDECPVDLAEIVSDAGFAVTGEEAEEVSVDTAPAPASSMPTDTGLSVLDRAGGVFIECEQTVEGGTVSLLIFASATAGASDVAFLPTVQRALRLSVDETQIAFERIVASKDEGMVDLDDLGDAPFAMAPIEVPGAEGSMLVVTVSDGTGATRLDAEAMLREAIASTELSPTNHRWQGHLPSDLNLSFKCRYLRVAMVAAPAFGVATMCAVSYVRPMPTDRRGWWRGGRGSADSVHGLRKRIPADRPDSLTQLLGRTDATRLRPIDGCGRRRGVTDRSTALSCTPSRSARDRKDTDRDPLRNDRRCDTERQRRFARQSLER